MSTVSDPAHTDADAILEALPAAVCVLDAEERHLSVNAAYAAWFGRDPDDILGRALADLHGSAQYAVLRPHVAAALAGGRVRTELHAADSAGRERRFDVTLLPMSPDACAPPRVLCLAIGAAEPPAEAAPDPVVALLPEGRAWHAALESVEGELRREAAARRLAEERRDGLLAALPDLMFELDTEGRIVDYHAPEPTRLIVPPERFLGVPAAEVLPAAVSTRLAEALDVLDRTGEMQRFEYRVGGGAELRHYEARLVGLARGNRLAIVRDITDLRQAGFEIAALNRDLAFRAAELEASNRELESFSYSVSHDLRAPLRAIDGFSRLLALHCEDLLDVEGRGYIERIRRGVARMSQLIDDLLQLSRASRVEIVRSRVDLGALAGAMAEELAATDATRDVAFDIAPGLIAHGDPTLLRMVIANLVGNAWKFTSRRSGARIEVGRASTEHGDAFYVRDNGAGFDMAFADKLFQAFHRLHSPHEFEGSGIGLATVHRVVRRHGGRVWAEAEVDRGATIWIVLP